MAWLGRQTGARRSGRHDPLPDLAPHKDVLSMYEEGPQGEVRLQEFEAYAMDRLRVLKAIEEARAKGTKPDALQALVKGLVAKHLKEGGPEQSQWRDAVSHFVLRLAYCRTEELRRWFIQQECELFRCRFKEEVPSKQVEFLLHHKLPYEILSGAEYEAALPQLMDLEESLGHEAFARSLQEEAPTSEARFFKVPFERVPDLVGRRQVLLVRGTAYVSRHDVASLVLGHFRTGLFIISKSTWAGLSRGLALLARRWAATLAAEEADRLTPLVESLSQRYLGPEYGSGAELGEAISAADVPVLAKDCFPLCMQNMYQRLHQDRHLKHQGRLQFGLFLKGLGLPLDEAVRFWRQEFSPRTVGDAFDKNYLYNVRYNYGREGKRTDYTPHACLSIIASQVPKDEAFGCPYKTWGPERLTQVLQALRLDPAKASEAVSKAKAGHYQLACAAAYEGVHRCTCETGINHPNQYAEESRKVLRERAAGGAAGQTPGGASTPGTALAGRTPAHPGAPRPSPIPMQTPQTA